MKLPRDGLRACLSHASAHVPYYRARAAAYDPALDFTRVPLLSKDALRDASPLDFVADGVDITRGLRDGALEVLSTSGTSGEQISVWADADHVGVPADDLELWDLAPIERLQRVAVLASPQCLGATCDGSYDSRLRAGGTQLILPSTEEPLLAERELAAAIVAEIARHDAGELFVNPVYLHALVRACSEHAVPLPDPELILMSYQYATRCQRRALAEAFPRAKIYSFYGASELGGATVGIECRHGKMHVWHDQAYVEVVDDAGRLVGDGERGLLAITTIGIRVTPIIRYVIGDLGIVRDEPCRCPLAAFPTLEHHGRRRDAIALAGCLLSTRDVDDAIGAPDGLDVWQLVHDRGELELRCVAALDRAFDAEPVLSRVSALAGQPVRARIVDAIDPEPSGKVAHTRSGLAR